MDPSKSTEKSMHQILEAETNFDRDLQDMKLEKAQKEW